MVCGTIYGVMTIISMASQTTLYEYFGDKGCFAYWLSSVLHCYGIIFAGLGMAIFRLVCITNKTDKPNDVASKIFYGTLTIMTLLVALQIFGVTLMGKCYKKV